MKSRAVWILSLVAAAAMASAVIQALRAQLASEERDRQLELLATTEADAARIAALNQSTESVAGSVPPQRVASLAAAAMEEAGLPSRATPTVSAAEPISSSSSGRDQVGVSIDLPPLSEAEIGLALKRLESNLTGWVCTRVTLRARPDRGGGRSLYTASLTFVGYAADE